MSNIWTSRYSNPELRSGNYYPVGISLGRPKFSLGYKLYEQCYMLAPTRAMWNIVSDEDFEVAYVNNLEKIGKEKIRETLEMIMDRADGKDVVLLCFEDVRDESQCCHRTMLAKWLNENFETDVRELYDPSEVKLKKKAAAKTEESKSGSASTSKAKAQAKSPIGLQPADVMYGQMNIWDYLKA